MNRFALLALFASIGFGLVLGQQRHAQTRRDIHVGILLVSRLYDQATQMYLEPENPTPHVWYNLDRNGKLKPSGWSLANPRAEATLTPDGFNRWNALAPGTVPAPGTRLTKAAARYWEVPLETANEAQLADYDVLLLSSRGTLSLTSADREKLRAYVDGGGLLWIDVAASTLINPTSPPPLAFDKGAGAAGPIRADYQHPLLSTPNQVGIGQLEAMQSDTSPGVGPVVLSEYGTSNPAEDLSTRAAILGSVPFDFSQLQSVAGDSTGSLVAFGRLGDGHLMITARGIATTLNRVKGSANLGFWGQNPVFDSASDAAAALLFNALHANRSYSQPLAGSRKRSSIAVDLGAPLLRTFQAPSSVAQGDIVPPATYRGLFVVSANDRVMVYDGRPGNDLDGDGNADDGVVDASLGEGLDLVWVSAAQAGPISPPTCVGVSNPSGPARRDQILVVDGTGNLVAFDAFAAGAADLNNVAPIYALGPPGGAASFDFSVPGRGPYAPTVIEGMAYVADVQGSPAGGVGRVWVMNVATGQRVATGAQPWVVGGTAAPYIPETSFSPTVGYVPIQDNSGGEDLVLYLPTRPNKTNFNAADATAGLTSLWIGARGERPIEEPAVIGSSLNVKTRASLQGLRVYLPAGSDPNGVKLSVFRRVDGRPLTAAEYGDLFSGAVSQGPRDGELNFGLAGTWDPSLYTVRVDYRIDWGTDLTSMTPQIVRGQLFFPDANRNRRVLGGIAMGPRGTLFLSVGDQTEGGSIYALREEGRGSFRLIYRYELYDQHWISLNMTNAVQYDETFLDQDPATTLVPALAGRFNDLTVQGPPAVRGDTVFVTVTGKKPNGNASSTILVALDGDPEPIRIPVGQIGSGFVLIQPDFARSTNLSQPEVQNVIQPNQYAYEPGPDGGVVRISNLMSSTRGIIQQAVSTSQPLILRVSGEPDRLIEPNAVGGSWSPLLWYAVVHGSTTSSPAFVSGDTVFVAGNSLLLTLLDPTAPVLPRGALFAVSRNVGAVAPDVITITGRPWMKQVPLLSIDGGDAVPNGMVRWPQVKSRVPSGEWKDYYAQALRSASVRGADTVHGLAGGEGALFMQGLNQLYGFSMGELLVADEGRLVRMDSGGNVLWSSDASRGGNSDTVSGNTSTVRPLVRPTRAYRLGNDELVVADPGSNRVVRLSLSGREIRAIGGFNLDPNFRPEGFQAGSPLNLNAPTDVSAFSTYVRNVNPGDNPLSGASALEYWVHYVIADAGNRRLLELVDRYVADPNTGEVLGPVQVAGASQLGILVWHSPASVSGKNFAYNSLDRTLKPGSSEQLYAAAIGGTQPTRADLGLDTPSSGSPRESGTGSGGIVLFDGEVISQVPVPAIPANAFWSESANMYSSPASPSRVKPLRAVNSVTLRYITVGAAARLAVMFADSTGVYEVYQPIVGPNQPWEVRWMLPREAFRFMRQTAGTPNGSNPQDFRPNFARRLDSGEILVVNGYFGKTRAGDPFTGEVLILNADDYSLGRPNLGHTQLSIRLQLSDLENVRDLSVPVFADLR